MGMGFEEMTRLSYSTNAGYCNDIEGLCRLGILVIRVLGG